MTNGNADVKVSVGLAVYNGAQYLAEAIESILNQDHENLELIISDNGSEDATQQIAQLYVDRDARIKYYRYPHNLGGSKNGRRVLDASSGKYFMWAAHDDLRERTMISECVAILESDPSVVLCYPVISNIDENGRTLGPLEDEIKIDHDTAEDRFLSVLWQLDICSIFYGLIRSDVLHQLNWPVERSQGGDHVILGELALLGKFQKIHKPLFTRRFHGDRKYDSLEEYNSFRLGGNPRNSKEGVFLPFCEFAFETLNVVKFSDLDEKAKSTLYAETLKCFRERWGRHVSYEIHRAIALIDKGAYQHPWVGEAPKEVTLMSSQYYCSMLLSRLEMALMIFPDFPGLMKARAQCMVVLGRTAEATALLQLDRSAANNSKDLPGLFKQAKALEQQGRREQAVQVYRQIVSQWPEQVKASYSLGVLLFMAKSFEEAKVCFKRVLELTPEDASALNNLGVIAYIEKQYGPAEDYFQKALVIQPDYKDAQNGLHKVRVAVQSKES